MSRHATIPHSPGMLDLGFLIREPAGVYQAKAGVQLTAHQLRDFRLCPLLYHRKAQGLIAEHDSAAYLLGHATHTLILEGHRRFEERYCVGGPVNLQSKPVHSDEQVALVVQMRAMQYSSRAGENILDLFAGSGSTLIAAEQTGRRAYLMEMDGLYCDVIVKRWEEFTGRRACRQAGQAERVAKASPLSTLGKPVPQIPDDNEDDVPGNGAESC